MYVAGVKVPPLGSIQDGILQKFWLHEMQREVLRDKITFYQTLSMCTNKDTVKELMNIWADYVALSYGVKSEGTTKLFAEMSLMEEYEKIKNLRPRMKIDEAGNLVVTGLEPK
jgi:hypothetical protein